MGRARLDLVEKASHKRKYDGGGKRRTIEAVVFEADHELCSGGEVEVYEGEIADFGVGDLVLAFRRGLIFSRGK